MIKFFNKPKINRYVSFTFDDGFIAGAQKVAKIIHPHKATFYLVTGWVKPNSIEIKDEYNIDADHGDIKQWQKLAQLGHEIGSHTVSHPIPQEADLDEYIQSLDYLKHFHSGPYSLAMPYGLKSSYLLPYDSIRLCNDQKIFNSLNNLNFLELVSFDPVEAGLSINKMLKIINKLPSNSWLILRAHSLDTEGFYPWPSEYLKKLYKFLLSKNFEIKTVAEMTLKFNLNNVSNRD